MRRPQETSTRFIGWCPVCQRDIKVRAGTLVHHGYERPGVGYIIGDCPGVSHQPYETSTDACDYYLRVYVIPQIREIENTLAVLTRPEGPPYLTFQHYDITTRKILRDPHTGQYETINLTREQADALAAQLSSWDERYSWDRCLRAAIANTESRLKHWNSERDRMDRLIADWRPQPLRTVEQEIERQTQSRAEREADRTGARNAKIEAEVAKIQKRIDSAVRNKNASVLADIYESRKLREVSGYRLRDDEARALLQRDDVWGAFGLYSIDSGYVTGDVAKAILDDMAWGKKVPTNRPGLRYDRVPLPWPATLGGGVAKNRRS